jgi:hypothetical protein
MVGKLMSRRALEPAEVVQVHATSNPDEDADPSRAFRRDCQLRSLAQTPTDTILWQ